MQKKEMTEQEAQRKLEALCSRAEHCTFEMLTKMERWGISEDARQRVVAALVKGRYVDDERYAWAFASDKIRYNKWGKRKVDQALYMKHIDEDVRRRVLADFDDSELKESLRPLLLAKMKSTKAKSDYELSCKLIRFALGRGFGIEETRECLEDIIKNQDAEDDYGF